MSSIDPINSYNSIKTGQPRKTFVSVVVPAYNEAAIINKNLTILCQYMETIEELYRWELIVVNDGSNDETGDLAENFAKARDNVHVLHHMFNFRQGQALRFAFDNCNGDYIVIMDADLSYSPDHIERMLTKIRETRAKIVIASPYAKGGKVSNVPWLRRVLSLWANRFLSFTVTRDRFSDKLTTLTCTVRAYDRKFLARLNLKAMDMDIQPEIIYKAMILRARIVEIPAHLNWSWSKAENKGSLARKSSIRIFGSIVRSLISGYLFRPFMFFILPGLALILLSLYPIIWAFIHSISHFLNFTAQNISLDYRISEAIASGLNKAPHAFILGGFALVVGIQLLSLGFLALQKKRYFEELFHLESTIYRMLYREKPK
ncbi:glycosyltransferase family 2 protein [Thermodesulfobacteriota bacterium]